MGLQQVQMYLITGHLSLDLTGRLSCLKKNMSASKPPSLLEHPLPDQGGGIIIIVKTFGGNIHRLKKGTKIIHVANKQYDVGEKSNESPCWYSTVHLNRGKGIRGTWI